MFQNYLSTYLPGFLVRYTRLLGWGTCLEMFTPIGIWNQLVTKRSFRQNLICNSNKKSRTQGYNTPIPVKGTVILFNKFFVKRHQ